MGRPNLVRFGELNRLYCLWWLARCWPDRIGVAAWLGVTRESCGRPQRMLLPGFVHPVGAATPARSRFGGLIRSLPDSLPRVVACYMPASKCFLWPTPYDVAHRKEIRPNVHCRRAV